MFRRDPTRQPFGRKLLNIHRSYEQQLGAAEMEESNRVVLLSACAGAAVALGAYGAWLQREARSSPEFVENNHGEEVPMHVVRFARALDDVVNVDAAYRVAVWGQIPEMAEFYWRPNYEIEIDECATAFELRDPFESTVVHYGRPLAAGATVEDSATWLSDLVEATLYCMVSAALDEEIAPPDMFIEMEKPTWFDQHTAGRSAAAERLEQLAPEGLPIWE